MQILNTKLEDFLVEDKCKQKRLTPSGNKFSFSVTILEHTFHCFTSYQSISLTIKPQNRNVWIYT